MIQLWPVKCGWKCCACCRKLLEGCSKGADLDGRKHPWRSCTLEHRYDGRSSRSTLGYREWTQSPRRDAPCTAPGSTAHTVIYMTCLLLKLKGPGSTGEGGQTQEPDNTTDQHNQLWVFFTCKSSKGASYLKVTSSFCYK